MGGGRNGSERRTWKEEELGEVEERRGGGEGEDKLDGIEGWIEERRILVNFVVMDLRGEEELCVLVGHQGPLLPSQEAEYPSSNQGCYL